jgi:hypothetical protein
MTAKQAITPWMLRTEGLRVARNASRADGAHRESGMKMSRNHQPPRAGLQDQPTIF